MMGLRRIRSVDARYALTACTVALAFGCAAQRTEQDGTSAESRKPPRAVAPATASAPATTAPPATATILAAAPPAAVGTTEPRCREQRAQEFLLRDGQIAKIGAPAAERRAIEAARKQSIDYRTRHYGRFPGVGNRADNPHPPRFYAKLTKFMGLPVVVNQKVLPALACVEAALLRECREHPYQPKAVGGIRLDNTFVDYEVSNHVYGIAIDIDPDLNPCCNCVGKWRERDACKKTVSSPFERMAMPKCWVDVFERYGFHWLGHDELEDTMHFEFLGDPELIRAPG
jgi:hypothetical protein